MLRRLPKRNSYSKRNTSMLFSAELLTKIDTTQLISTGYYHSHGVGTTSSTSFFPKSTIGAEMSWSFCQSDGLDFNAVRGRWKVLQSGKRDSTLPPRACILYLLSYFGAKYRLSQSAGQIDNSRDTAAYSRLTRNKFPVCGIRTHPCKLNVCLVEIALSRAKFRGR